MKRTANIADLIEAPLIAAAAANSKMLKVQTAYLIETCFEKMESGSYEPVMIEMTITRSHIENSQNETPSFKDYSAKFKVPLLTLIPINTLAVDNVDINFNLEIVSQKETNSSQTLGEKGKITGGNDISTEKKTELSGKVSYDSKDSRSERSHNSSKLEIKMQAKSLPLPRGITTIIDLYVNSINAKPKTKNHE